MTPIFCALNPVLRHGYVILFDAGLYFGCEAGALRQTRAEAAAILETWPRQTVSRPFAVVRVIPKPGCEGARLA